MDYISGKYGIQDENIKGAQLCHSMPNYNGNILPTNSYHEWQNLKFNHIGEREYRMHNFVL